MNILSNAEIAQIRTDLEVTLWHRYTRTQMVGGTVENDWGDAPPVASGAATASVPCRYEAAGRVVRDETGAATILGPTLTVSATDPLAVGDEIDAVTDQLGTVLAAGPLRVERLLDASGVGAPFLLTYELLAASEAR